MTEPDNDPGEQIDFPGGWRGLYLFIVVYGVVQILLLYFFTRAYNQ